LPFIHLPVRTKNEPMASASASLIPAIPTSRPAGLVRIAAANGRAPGFSADARSGPKFCVRSAQLVELRGFSTEQRRSGPRRLAEAASATGRARRVPGRVRRAIQAGRGFMIDFGMSCREIERRHSKPGHLKWHAAAGRPRSGRFRYTASLARAAGRLARCGAPATTAWARLRDHIPPIRHGASHCVAAGSDPTRPRGITMEQPP